MGRARARRNSGAVRWVGLGGGQESVGAYERGHRAIETESRGVDIAEQVVRVVREDGAVGHDQSVGETLLEQAS